jgi:hypothetical protein
LKEKITFVNSVLTGQNILHLIPMQLDAQDSEDLAKLPFEPLLSLHDQCFHATVCNEIFLGEQLCEGGVTADSPPPPQKKYITLMVQ